MGSSIDRRRLLPALLLVVLGTAFLILSRPGPARAEGFQCLPAPEGWTLDVVAPTRDATAQGGGEWRAQCLYASKEATIKVGPGHYEGGLAEADVFWSETAGSCPLPTFDLQFTTVPGVSDEFPSGSKRAIATSYYEPALDPWSGGIKDLAADLLADAETRAAECTEGGGGETGSGGETATGGETGSGGETDSGGGPSPEAMEIAGGLILLLLGGGGLLFSGSGGGTGLLTRGKTPPGQTSGQDPADQPKAPPIVTITSPGQGDEVGEHVTVTGTVTGALSVVVISPGGGGTGSAAGGTFAVTTRVGVKHAAIVVEAVNAEGSGRAAVHVFRPDAPEWLPEDEKDHREAEHLQSDEAHSNDFLAQKDADQAAQIAASNANLPAAPPPPPAPGSAAPIVPKSYDELMGRLSRPNGGAVAISGKDATKLLPPGSAWMGKLVSGVTIDGDVVTVNTPFGGGSGSLWLNQGGRIVFDPTTIGPDQTMVSDDLARKVQAHLDDITNRLGRSGVRVTEVRIDGGRIWISTGPR